MDALKEWWSQASSRDQLALVIGGGFLSLYLLFMVVLSPVQNMREKEETKNNALRNSLENVRSLAAQVMAQKATGGKENSRGSIENIVQQSVAAKGLQVASMAASGKDGVRLRFDEANFEKVLQWLFEMEVTHNFRIKDLSVASASNPGMVTINLRIHKN
ncbi:MAG: type II secretion system protein M [Agarilytica sp.]